MSVNLFIVIHLISFPTHGFKAFNSNFPINHEILYNIYSSPIYGKTERVLLFTQVNKYYY